MVSVAEHFCCVHRNEAIDLAYALREDSGDSGWASIASEHVVADCEEANGCEACCGRDELPPRPITVGPWRAQEMRIRYIERLPRVAAMCCIKVAAADGIFLAGHGYVPTHNSFTIGYEDALHITGMYPDWWKGRLFNEPVEWLVSGLSNESTRKVLTPLLLGKVRQLAGRNYVDGSGMIPASHFVPGSLLFRGGSGESLGGSGSRVSFRFRPRSCVRQAGALCRAAGA